MKIVVSLALVLLATGASTSSPEGLHYDDEPQAIDLAKHTIVDLSHAYGPSTVFWPTSPKKFELEKLASGKTEGGYFYAANMFAMPEHGGTHLDAPYHFSETGRTTERIPLEQLVAAAVVIDVTASATANRDYRATPDDVLQFEKKHGTITRGTIVLLRTGWSHHWPNVKAYLGDDTPGDASKLSFPSFGEDAARLLVEARGAAALGVDTASIDYGRSTDFKVHRIAAARNVPGLENLTSLDKLPPRGAIVVALPLKIEGGSGGPLRAIALVPK
ncbi:MAG TPA: cyclase family protein [Vicinamibacterales bacterium]|nr:cyclase family protein [Vicinamibacterales bacterium]